MKRQASHVEQDLLRATRRRFNEAESEEDAVELALSIIITEGFLYRHDCRAVAATSRLWSKVWGETRDRLPEKCLLEVLPTDFPSDPVPDWIADPALITSPTFLRHVFEKIRKLKVAAKRTKKKRAQAEKELPVFEDFEVALVTILESSRPRRRITGPAVGYHIEFDIKSNVVQVGLANPPPATEPTELRNPGFTCQLYPNFKLMAGIRCWRVYDGKPLWP